MRSVSNDKRALETNRKIIKAYTDLLEDCLPNQITVKAICAKASINRGTFYLHYENVDDLNKTIEQNIYTGLFEILYNRSLEELENDGLDILEQIFKFLDKNSDICSIMIERRGSITQEKKLGKMFNEKLQNEWRPLLGANDELIVRYASGHIINSLIGLFQLWVEGEKKESPKEMAHIFDCVMTGSLRS